MEWSSWRELSGEARFELDDVFLSDKRGRSISTPAATYKCSFAFRDTGGSGETGSSFADVSPPVPLYRFFAIRNHDVAIVPTLMFISDVPPTLAPIGPRLARHLPAADVNSRLETACEFEIFGRRFNFFFFTYISYSKILYSNICLE